MLCSRSNCVTVAFALAGTCTHGLASAERLLDKLDSTVRAVSSAIGNTIRNTTSHVIGCSAVSFRVAIEVAASLGMHTKISPVASAVLSKPDTGAEAGDWPAKHTHHSCRLSGEKLCASLIDFDHHAHLLLA